MKENVYRSLNPSRVFSLCSVFWVWSRVKTTAHIYWFNLDNIFLQLVSSVCEKLFFSFLNFLVIRNILMFSTSKRKRRRLLKSDVPRYVILLMSVTVDLLWSINVIFLLVWLGLIFLFSWQQDKHQILVNFSRYSLTLTS